MEEIEKILKEQQKTNELLEKMLARDNVTNELLTAEQVHNEFGIGINTARKMFKDSELAVQKYTSPHRVSRQALIDYLSKPHDYLSERR